MRETGDSSSALKRYRRVVKCVKNVDKILFRLTEIPLGPAFEHGEKPQTAHVYVIVVKHSALELFSVSVGEHLNNRCALGSSPERLF